MMRPLLLIIVLFRAAASFGQTYGNEWIDHDRQYWRFDVYSTGLHRLDSVTLANAGFPIATVDPAEIMLFGREQQVPLYIQGGDDGVLNAGDFIEFVGRKNDGWIDTRMYGNAQQHINPYYSQYNDTIHYFITWDPDPLVEKRRVLPYVNTDIDSYTPEPWVWGFVKNGLMDFYWPGFVDPGLGATSGLHQSGEGWGGAPLYTSDVTVEQGFYTPTPSPYIAADAPPVTVHATAAAMTNPGGFNYDDHHLQIYAGPGAGELYIDSAYRGAVATHHQFEMPASAMTSALYLRYRVPHDLPLSSWSTDYLDFQAAGSATVRYARTLAMGGNAPTELWVPNGTGQLVSRLDLSGYTGTPVLYAAGETMHRILPTAAGATWQALVPAFADSATTETIVLPLEGVRLVSGLSRVNQDGYFVDYGDMDPDSAFLMVTHRSLWTGANAYAQYRSSAAPGTRPTVLADVDELYDQFGGGVPKNGLAIRMWSKYVLDHWTTDPRGLFLIGKSVTNTSVALQPVGMYPPLPNGAYERCLVPSYGYPACDQCFTIGLHNDPRLMEIPVGRLSASTDEQVLAYLGKVQSFEAQPPASWMKRVGHLSGGNNAAQQDQLAGILTALEPRIDENSAFGADVWSFRKSSSSILETAAADSVRQLIEGGVTFMNFFAHAYSESFDITIDDPSNYDWNGRYPMVMGNSCYIGNVHLNADLASTTEDWVMRDGAGPVAFLAGTLQGLISTLAPYCDLFYTSWGTANYGGTIGDHMRYAAFNYLGSQDNILVRYQTHTMTLQGDPALVLNSPRSPDYAIGAQDIFFDPPTVTADVDTFSVKVVVRNIGRVLPDTVSFRLERTNAGLTGPQIHTTTLAGISYQDTAIFRLPTLAFAGGQGVNQLSVRVDMDPDLIPELDDSGNNQAATTLFITSGDLVPTYPYDLAIVPDASPMLKASTGDPLAGPRNYVFQIDTTDLFNSPLRETTLFESPGGVVTWQPTSIYAATAAQDSTVYFWRCSIDSTGNGGYSWYERSFQHIPDRHGWGQAHYFQFKNDEFSTIVYDRPDRDFEFTTAPHEISAWSPGFDYYGDIGWRLDLVPQEYNGCSAEAAWHVAVVDPYTFEAWATRWTDNSVVPPVTYNPDHNFGNHNDNPGNCGRNRPMKYFSFRQNVPAQMASLKAMLEGGIPNGHHVLMYTWLYMNKDGMASEPGLMPYMEDVLGAPLSSLQDSVPYIFYVRKGFAGTFQDTIGTDINSDIRLTAFVESSGDQGFITTMEAGPALEWGGLYWNEHPVNATDSTRIQIRGISASGQEVDLGEWPSAQDEVLDLGSIVDASLFPKVRIRGKFHDIGATVPKPAQMERWQLLHTPVPECAINPQLGYFQALDGWFQGQTASVAVAVQNISEFDMDSLLIEARVVDRHNIAHRVHYRRHAPLPAGAWYLDTLHFSTLPFGGLNTLIVEANPVDTLTDAYDQPEQYHFNNIAQWRFDVAVDNENPLLDVTFDGIHILDGDIVSARPEIEISLNDENTVLLLDSPADTAQFKVFLARPGVAGERIYFRDGQGNENLQFIPADGPDNEARIYYRPAFVNDGKYLLTVQASDLSANVSGDNDYKIGFEVINRSTITEVLNYPNPFTTSTRFVFTLTGSVVPSYMKIQIMTVTGKVVREVKMHELGPLRVGRNITDFAWDGTDEFGDKLARGVYLYRVITQINGEDVEYRATDAATYFTKGFGKMYKL
ncbi:MAG: hypothetical protein JNM62_09600 [Flavobacteriales bacterium]|nr:hypothetical protein [Flavobacteriales bacterium]